MRVSTLSGTTTPGGIGVVNWRPARQRSSQGLGEGSAGSGGEDQRLRPGRRTGEAKR